MAKKTKANLEFLLVKAELREDDAPAPLFLV